MQDKIMKLRDGRILGFADCGTASGTPVFLFHGTPGSRMYYRGHDSEIEAYQLRVVTPERPGYGLSDPKPDRTIEDWADDVRQLADHLGIARFHVAGGSGGGPYALACALKMPDRAISVTLIGSAAPPKLPGFYKDMAGGNKIVFLAARYVPVLLKLLLWNYASTVKRYPQKFIEKLPSQLCEWDRRVFEDRRKKGVKEAFLGQLKEAFRQGIEGAYRDMMLVSRPWGLDLQALTTPVFMWHGESDTLMPIRPAKAFARLIPTCECHFIPEAGHQLLRDERTGKQIVERLLSVS